MIKQYINGSNVKIKINDQDLPHAQTIEFSASADTIMQAKFICCKDPLVYTDEGVEEVYGVGIVADIERTRDHIIFHLDMDVDTPNAEYFKEKFYPSLEVEHIDG